LSKQSETLLGPGFRYVLKYSILSFVAFWFLLAGYALPADDGIVDSPMVFIDSIEIDNQNIFSLDSAKYDYWIYRLANKLHVKTKKHVIGRELLLRKGEVYSQRLAEESERNLRSLAFLWNARVELYRSGDGLNIMRVTTNDAWTLLAALSISRNSGEVTYHFKFEDLNFLGLGQTISAHYYLRDSLENYAQVTYTERRLFGSRNYLSLFYDGNPEVGSKGFSVGRPFYSLNSQVQYSISYTSLDKRKDIYSSGGKITAWEQVLGENLGLSGFYRFGSYHNKVLAGLNYKYIDIGPTDSMIDVPDTNNIFSGDSLYWALTPEFGIYSMHYVRTTRINTFRTTEDILLQKGGKIEHGWAFEASNHSNIYRTFALVGSYDAYIKSNLFFAKFTHIRWFKGNTTFRKSLSLSIKYYNNYFKWLTPMLRAVYTEDIIEQGGHTLYLGENNGLRGYPRNYSTGQKRLIANIENRVFFGIEILSVDMGAVQFVDLGRGWGKNESMHLRDIYWSVGFGLRFSAERVSNARMMRLDLAYAGEIKDWQLSFGVGHYIN
jgi:outer membrane protein assembly factor BamA